MAAKLHKPKRKIENAIISSLRYDIVFMNICVYQLLYFNSELDSLILLNFSEKLKETE